MTFVNNMHSFLSFFSQDYVHTNEKHACSIPHPLPVIKPKLPLTSPLKRKRDRDTSSSPDSVDAKRFKQTVTSTERPAQSSTSSSKTRPDAVAEKDATVARPQSDNLVNVPAPSSGILAPASPDDTTIQAQAVRRDPKLLEYAIQKIEAHLNLQILYKHNEHRLIEQELAKCQIAQEQLRRCRLIPYPGQTGASDDVHNIAAGTGPTLASQPGFTNPPAAAPWGVTDGPYTKHYAHWLIPDPRFEPLPDQQQAEAPAAGKAPTRSARNVEPSSRSQRRSTAANISIPSSKSAGPLTVRRASDGVMVKLICKLCGKEDFSNLQGFLNHCRIGHKLEYANHGAALDDCGVPLDEAELSALSVSGVIDTLPSTSNVVIQPTHTLLVHPLIKENRRDSTSSLISKASPSTHSRGGGQPVMAPPKIPSRLASGLSAGGASSTASPATPRLSAFFASQGGIGDMSSLVERMQDRSDYNNILEQLPSDDEEPPPKASSKPKARNRGRRIAVQGGASATERILTLQLPPHRLASITSEASMDMPRTSSKNHRASGPTPSTTDTTAPPWTSTQQSVPFYREIPPSNISASASAFRQRSEVANSSSGLGSAMSTFTLSQPSQGSIFGPRTPVNNTTAEAMDISPTNAAAETPTLMTDNEEGRSQDEESDVVMDDARRSSVRIRTSVDETGVRDGKKR